MGVYNESIYDEIGNEYDRKNLYLLDLAKIQKKLSQASNNEKQLLKKELENLIKNKDKHLYNIKLMEYKNSEKLFLDDLRVKRKAFINNLDKNISQKIKKLEIKLFDSTQKYNFYKDYLHISYEAELIYKQNLEIKDQLPKLIKFINDSKIELKDAIEQGKNIDKNEESNAYLELKRFKIQQKKLLSEEKQRLKRLKASGTISKKAKKNGIIEFKKKSKKNLELKKLESPSRANTEYRRSKSFEIKNVTRQRLKVLNADIADLRRKTPVELTKSKPIIAYSTLLFPGLGQILNSQYIKGLFLSLITLFSYFIAFPYALGKGNYQGQGIAGLITLAEGQARIDKSLIYMIEGVIAIILVVIAVLLIFASFKDVLKVEKSRIRGIRPRNWFETKENISQSGFPYLVSFPGLFIILFVIIVPILTTTLLSFTNMDPKHQSKFQWIFLDNYKQIALGEGLAGSVFWLIFTWTVIWTLLATSLAIFIGFGLALLVNNNRVKGKLFFRTIYILPWAVPAFVTIMFFSILFSPNGALTNIIVNIAGKRVEVKNDPTLIKIVLIILQGWLGSAYVFLLSTGVLQSIPGDLYEAADIDGATAWQRLKKITIPIVLFQIAPLLVTQYTFNFNNFSVIFLFNEGGPFNPNKFGNLAGSSDLLISYIYKLTTDNKYQAIGAAITIVISLGLMVFAYLGFRNSKGFKEGKL